MGFLFWPFLSVLPEAKTVSHQAHMARLGFSLLLTDLKSQILWSLSPESFSKNPCSNGSAHYQTSGVTVPARLHTGLLSVHTGHQTVLPKSKATVAFGRHVTFALWRGYNQRQLGNSTLELLLQWMRASKNWLPIASSSCPVFFGAGC